MSLEKPESWPLRPSHSAHVAHTLCMAFSDLLSEEGGGRISRRAYLKACGLAVAAELFSREVSHWFSTRMGEDHDLLEALQDRLSTE